MNRLTRILICGPTVFLVLASLSLATPPSFVDDTVAAGLSNTHAFVGFDNGQYSSGVSVGDFNNDGWQDVFVIKGGASGLPDRLFINNGDGTFTDQAAAWGLTVAHRGKATCVGDYDNDGWLDLFVGSAGVWNQSVQPGQNKLYHNNGNGTFTDVAVAAGVNLPTVGTQGAWSASFGDYDLDGDLDLVHGGFVGGSSAASNRLFRNNGDGTFTDVTAAALVFTGAKPIAAFSETWVDMNGDRYPELLVGADFQGSGSFQGSRYYANNGNGTFTDLSNTSGTTLEDNGMGQTVGDFDRDGDMDWYVTTIQGFGGDHNRLYRNNGNHSYTEVGATLGVGNGGYGWGTVAIDFNNDTYLDIAETNEDAGTPGPQVSRLWVQNSNGNFTEMSAAANCVKSGSGRGLVSFDADNDGDQDMIFTNNAGTLTFFRNTTTGPDTHWIRIFLNTMPPAGGVAGVTPLAPNGFGSFVKAKIGSITQTRAITGGVSFLGVSELSAHFGLSSHPTVDEVRVLWNDGTETVMNDVPGDQTITIYRYPQGPASDLNEDGIVDGADLGLLLAGWGDCPRRGVCTGDLNDDGVIDGADLGLLLAEWTIEE